MGTTPIQQNSPAEPELRLLGAKDLYEEPLWKSLFREVDEFFFPKKLPPLQLESKPVPVKEIWGFYDNKSRGFLGSTAAHIVILGLLIGGAYWHFAKPVMAKQEVTSLIDPGDYVLKPSKSLSGGGGGGGDKDILQASKGRPPKMSTQQITPPAAVIRNMAPKLSVDPTIVAPEVKMAMAAPPVIGDPLSHAVMPSNGTGSLSGVGSGSLGGVGAGNGIGLGKGDTAGTGGGAYRVGHGASAPRIVYSTEPEFSEEARKAKYQGTCTLYVVVDASGRPTNIRVASSLGMGLDEKAIESVKNWKFEPGKDKDGHPVPVEIAVEVDFHLY